MILQLLLYKNCNSFFFLTHKSVEHARIFFCHEYADFLVDFSLLGYWCIYCAILQCHDFK